MLLVIGFVEWINLLGCWLNQDCTLPCIRNKDYHLMHRGVKPVFIKVWSILTHPIFKCCDLTSLKSYFTIIINLYKKLNPNISSTCNFNCFANILQMPYWFFFFLYYGWVHSCCLCLVQNVNFGHPLVISPKNILHFRTSDLCVHLLTYTEISQYQYNNDDDDDSRGGGPKSVCPTAWSPAVSEHFLSRFIVMVSFCF